MQWYDDGCPWRNELNIVLLATVWRKWIYYFVPRERRGFIILMLYFSTYLLDLFLSLGAIRRTSASRTIVSTSWTRDYSSAQRWVVVVVVILLPRRGWQEHTWVMTHVCLHLLLHVILVLRIMPLAHGQGNTVFSMRLCSCHHVVSQNTFWAFVVFQKCVL